MTDLEVGLLILLIIGVIASNLVVLKYSTKFKMSQFGKGHKKTESKPLTPSEENDQPQPNNHGKKTRK